MPKPLTANDFKKKAYELKSYWSPRADQFADWYKLLRLDDELATDRMESFTTNDPRTLFNLALFLLTPKEIPYNIPINDANQIVQDAITQTEAFFTTQWKSLEASMRRKSRQGWRRYVTSLALSTGWIAVRSIANNSGLFADVWNPAEVFPDFDPDIGLGYVVHMYMTSASAARKQVANNQSSGWEPLTFLSEADVEVIDSWYYGDDGCVWNNVVMASKFAKKPTCHMEFDEIPIHVTPIAGLPDEGSIDLDPIKWKKNVGESIVATNANLYRSYNRQMSFMQQILRDSAQPRIMVRSKSKGIVTETNWNKRGAIYEMDLDESIDFLSTPGLPPELSLGTQVTERQIERGGLPFALYTGEGMQSGYQQSLTSASADEILRDYREAISFLITDVCNSWLNQIRKNNYKPLGFELPQALPLASLFDVEIKVSIPGDLIQRATTARQLDPNFRLSNTTTMDLLFPEIRDPNREIVLGRRDSAMSNPIMAELDLMGALEDQANALAAEGNMALSTRYRNAAKLLESQMGQAPAVNLAQGAKEYLNPPGQAPGPPGQQNAGRP